MGKFDNTPVVDFDRLEEIKSNPDILPKDAIKIKKEAVRVEVKPKSVPYRPGDTYKTENYPGYEGFEIYVVVGTANSAGLVRYTVSLPDLVATPPSRRAECPHCRVPFVGAELIYPGRGKKEAETIDRTTTLEDFAEALKWWQAKKI